MKSPPLFPFSFSLRERSAEEMARYQEAWTGRGNRRLPLPEEALAAIRQGSENLPPLWASHPDERVAEEFLKKEARELKLRPALHLVNATAAAQERARREGLLWTRLLDRLERESCFRGGSSRLPHLETGEPLLAAWNGDWLRPLGEWVEAVEEARLLERLAQFQSRSVHAEIARRARAWSQPLLERLLRLHPDLAVLVAQNPSLPPKLRASLGEWAYAQPGAAAALERLVETWGEAGERVEARARADLERPHATRGSRACRYFLKKPVLEAEMEELLMRYLETPGAWNDLIPAALHPTLSYPRRQQLARALLEGGQRAWFFQAGKRQLLPPDLIRAASEHLVEREDPELRELAFFLGSPKEVLREVALRYHDVEVQKRIAAHPEAWKDPEVHKRLAGSRSPEVQLAYARGAEAAEVARVFRSLAGRYPDLAADLLESPGADCSALSREDLLPLLSSPLPRVREAALRGVGRLSSASASPPSPAREKSRSRA